MAALLEWLQERRSEGLGSVLSLLMIGAGLAGMVWLGWTLWPGHGSGSFDGRNLSALVLQDADGTSHRVGDLRGKVVVLDFWATWCPPCRLSLPEVAALQAGQGEDYAVLPVSLDRGGFRDVAPFLQQNPQLALAAVVPADLSALMAQVGRIEAIPTTLVVGRNGRVVKSWSGYSPGLLERELRAALRP